ESLARLMIQSFRARERRLPLTNLAPVLLLPSQQNRSNRSRAQIVSRDFLIRSAIGSRSDIFGHLQVIYFPPIFPCDRSLSSSSTHARNNSMICSRIDRRSNNAFDRAFSQSSFGTSRSR